MPGKRYGINTLGLLIVCLCLMTPLANAGTPSANKAPPKVLQDSVVFTHIPADGLYWNTHKIANYSAPVFIRLRQGYVGSIGTSVTGKNIHQVYFYIDGSLMYGELWPPYSYIIDEAIPLPAFSNLSALTTKVYMNDGQIIWDNLTVYRLF